jgi:hypothetical protein
MRLLARSLRVVSEARWGKAPARARCVGALSIQRLEGSRPRGGRGPLCKFNDGKERRRAVPRLCRRVRHVTERARKLAECEKGW